jgi:hypothetical protein
MASEVRKHFQRDDSIPKLICSIVKDIPRTDIAMLARTTSLIKGMEDLIGSAQAYDIQSFDGLRKALAVFDESLLPCGAAAGGGGEFDEDDAEDDAEDDDESDAEENDEDEEDDQDDEERSDEDAPNTANAMHFIGWREHASKVEFIVTREYALYPDQHEGGVLTIEAVKSQLSILEAQAVLRSFRDSGFDTKLEALVALDNISSYLSLDGCPIQSAVRDCFFYDIRLPQLKYSVIESISKGDLAKIGRQHRLLLQRTAVSLDMQNFRVPDGLARIVLG